MHVQQMAVSSQDEDDMEPIVRLAIETGLQSLAAAAADCSMRRKRKREVVQVNGSVDDVGSMKKKNNGISENCDESSQRKKRKKAPSSEQSDIRRSLEEVTGTAIAGELTGAADGSNHKSELEDEVEIWIPNKKYKGPLRDAYAKLAKTGSSKVRCASHKKDDSAPFMTFVPSDKTPVALVRRRNRLTQSEPKQLQKSVSLISTCDNVQL